MWSSLLSLCLPHPPPVEALFLTLLGFMQGRATCYCPLCTMQSSKQDKRHLSRLFALHRFESETSSIMEEAGGVWSTQAVSHRASGSPRLGHRPRRDSTASFASSEEMATSVSDAQASLLQAAAVPPDLFRCEEMCHGPHSG